MAQSPSAVGLGSMKYPTMITSLPGIRLVNQYQAMEHATPMKTSGQSGDETFLPSQAGHSPAAEQGDHEGGHEGEQQQQPPQVDEQEEVGPHPIACFRQQVGWPQCGRRATNPVGSL